MNISNQSVDQTVSAMAEILAEYLHPEEVRLLTTQWQRYSVVSVKMMQQCILDATRRYPELQAYKSEIRKGFWGTVQVDHSQPTSSDTARPPLLVPELVLAFYTVMETIATQLTAPDRRYLFHSMHQTVSNERTFKGHTIPINRFLEGSRPPITDDAHILNNVVQLAYVCLCDIVGPVEADDVLFQAAQMAKQRHAKAVVAQLF